MRLTLLLLVSLALAGCNRPGPAPTAADVAKAPTAPVAPPTPEPAPEATCEFCAVPAQVRECDVVSGVRTTLQWRVDPSVPVIAIYVVGDDGQETLFTEQPATGSAQTGPWVKPGLTFRLKSPDGKVLHTLVMQGTSC
jgi:hypothetical protein